MWKTTIHLGFALLFMVGGIYACFDTSSRQIALVDWSEVFQTIDGFGGSVADFQDSLTPAQADFFFTTSGIGLSILRTQIIPDAETCNAEFQKGGCSKSNGQILNGELATAQLAAARGAVVFSTPWSPPASFKSNGSFKNGGTLLPSRYSDWAVAIASYVSMMERNGVPIYAVSVQNEPDLTTDYGSCRFTAQEIHDFVPYLASALRSEGKGSTKIMIAEESGWSFDLASAALADPKVAPEIGILAAHGYRGEVGPFPSGHARLWQSEDSSQSADYDGSMTDGVFWARKIHSILTLANVNAWIWWFLTDMPHQGEGRDNAALTDYYGNFAKRAFVTGQWSRFVRPGWVRIGVKGSGHVLISAFKDPSSRAFVIVAINPEREPVSQLFSLKGFTARSLSPWITSFQLSLAPLPPVSIHGTSFTYTLPGMSVVTFSGSVSE